MGFDYSLQEGWKNYETWHVAVWIDNDYPAAQRRDKLATLDVDTVKAFCFVELPRIAKEMRCEMVNVKGVLWADIAAHWQAKRDDEQRYQDSLKNG